MRRVYVSFVVCCALVLVAGCHHRRGHEPDFLSKRGYRYSAGSALVGRSLDTLRVAVVVVNESKEMRGIAANYCRTPANAVTARLVARGRSWSSPTNEEPVVFHDSAGNVMEQACVASLMLVTFPPGHSMTFVLKTPVKDILGDSLPPARYHVTARLWDEQLKAGDVTLSR
jgi:hypothetical protein